MRCWDLCFFFIILSVEVVRPSKKRNDCVKFLWNHKFEFSFFSKENHSLENHVRNLTNNCLQNHSAFGTKSCEGPAISVRFPLISGDPNITLNKLHRPVLATKEASTNTASQILRAFEQIWQLFILCLMAAMLSGILIWFFDHKANSGQFPNSFWSGIREGLWWAIVTMTTVGYGDKTPRSFLGRAYASLWMIIGMLLMSVFTAQISSFITADELSPLNEILGSKIGVPLGSKNFFRKYCYGAESVTEYSTERELLASLQNDTEDKVWLFNCQEKETSLDLDFMIVSVLDDELFVLPKPPTLGVNVQFLNRSNFDQDFVNCLNMPENRELKMKTGDVDDDDVDAVVEVIPEDPGYTFWEMDFRCLRNHTSGKNRKGVNRASSEKRLGLIDYALLACGALIIILLTIGALWNTTVRVRHKEIMTGNAVDVEMGVLDIGLEVKSSDLQTKELAAGSG